MEVIRKLKAHNLAAQNPKKKNVIDFPTHIIVKKTCQSFIR